MTMETMDNRGGAMHSRMDSPVYWRMACPHACTQLRMNRIGCGYPQFPQPILRLTTHSLRDDDDWRIRKGAGAESHGQYAGHCSGLCGRKVDGQPLTKRHGISFPAPAGVDTRLLAALRRGNDMISLWRSLRHRFHYRLCEAVSAEQIRHFKDFRRNANVYLTHTYFVKLLQKHAL